MIRIRELRQRKGWSMKYLGSLLGVSEASVSMYERELVEPDISTITKLADLFDVTVDELLGRSSDRRFSELDMRVGLSNGDEPITPEQFNEVLNYAHYIQEKDASK